MGSNGGEDMDTMGDIIATCEIDFPSLRILAWSAIEVFPKESLGIILGHITGDDTTVRIAIKQCIALQDVARGQSMCEALPGVPKRVVRCWRDDLIGVFHSHPRQPPVPSERDAFTMAPPLIRLLGLCSIYRRRSCDKRAMHRLCVRRCSNDSGGDIDTLSWQWGYYYGEFMLWAYNCESEDFKKVRLELHG